MYFNIYFDELNVHRNGFFGGGGSGGGGKYFNFEIINFSFTHCYLHIIYLALKVLLFYIFMCNCLF